jgi:CubicO group peptidase (beta-lactamase class C family)
MSNIDSVLAAAVERRDAPFLVGMVGDAGGTLWEGAAGPANATRPAGPDTVFRLFSMTKAIGAVGALILIDRGVLSLDTPVASVLPDFDRLQVLDSFGPDGPVLRAPRTVATLRHLLTHTNGLAYVTASEKQAHLVTLGDYVPDVRSGTINSFDFPLMCDPGAEWIYSVGLDWVGRMVAEVDGRSVENFYREEVLDPLGMSHTVFEPERDDHLSIAVQRSPDGGYDETEFCVAERPELYGMGQALYGTAPDYLRFLRMVLNGGALDGHRLLTPETFQLLATNQIGDLRVTPAPATVPAISDVVEFFPGVEKTWTAAFMRVEERIPGMRSAGSLSWAGVLNTHYWIDLERDVAAVFMTQLLPFCDPRVLAALGDFERQVYRELPTLRG